MSASSPIPINGNIDPAISPAAPNGAITPQRSTLIDTPRTTLRGLNKPKCIKCGNVARSRCPFQSCKSCCAKAQNPCYIHVLKLNGTLPDMPPPSSSPLPEPHSTDTPSTGAALRLSSLRQLSSTFINSLRTKRPLTRKDAVDINKWRFAKLKEHIEGNIEVENEAFDRYMQNVNLLEETFSVNSLQDELTPDVLSTLEPSSSEDEFNKLVAGIKIRLKSNTDRANNFRERVRGIVDEGLKKLQEWEIDDLDGDRELKRPKKVVKLRAEKTAAVNDLLDKLIKARCEDDLKSCLQMKLQLFNQGGIMDARRSNDQRAGDVIESEEASDAVPATSSYSPPKLCITIQVDQDTLSNIDNQFSSLDQIAEL